MVTYLQLNQEQVWRDQFVPPALDGLLVRLRSFYNLGINDVASAGDNNHLDGRHRSRQWDLGSRYCTNPSYGTTDNRDHGGDGNWYRVVDIGITGQRLFDACHRLDAAVRAGHLPGVAEWFGTFDGKTVVGWFEGRPGTSDSSHLTHQHIGFWNSSADDHALMAQVFAIVTGTENDMITVVEDDGEHGAYYLWDGQKAERLALTTPGGINDVGFVLSGRWPTGDPNGDYGAWMSKVVLNARIGVEPWLSIPKLPLSVLALVPATTGGGSPSPTAQEIADAVLNEAHDRLAA